MKALIIPAAMSMAVLIPSLIFAQQDKTIMTECLKSNSPEFCYHQIYGR